MKNISIGLLPVFALLAAVSCNNNNQGDVCHSDGSLYEYRDIETRWSSFENINAEKGRGGIENHGAKGHPSDVVRAGESVTLLNVTGPGMIRRIWITINDRSPEMLRSLKIEMFWDDSNRPAVSAPFGDFFGVGLGKTTVFENDLFADPEGRSFNCFIPMPFKKSARVVITNESKKDLDMLFFDIDLIKMKKWDPEYLYFHCYWHRDTATTPGEDFQILPKVSGKGRFLGSNIGIMADPAYKDHWWGEGEIKMYLDGDAGLPTLVGTGTEDYIGSGWGQGVFCTRYTGCLIADPGNRQWAYFRYHIPDPVYFGKDIKVTIQQMGGNQRQLVLDLLKKGVPLIPVAIYKTSEIYPFYDPAKLVNLEDENLPEAWTNYFRSDDVSAAAYFYLDKPENDLPPLQSPAVRTVGLILKPL